MTLRPAELKAQQKITRAFIAADARSVTLLRSERTPDGAGGHLTGDPQEVPAQTLRLLPQEDGATARTTADGEAATPEYMLLCPTGANVKRFDEFTLDGRRYQVVYIDDRQYEVKAEVIYLGE